MRKKLDLTGEKFGKLTAVRELPQRKDGKVVWETVCDCGRTIQTIGRDLKRGHTKSCGCLPSAILTKRNTSHGARKTRTYSIWTNMIQRCTNPGMSNFKYYGGRGISVPDEWKNFSDFLASMGHAPENMTLERINNAIGYSAENCKWANRTEQANNTRRNDNIEFNGKTQSLSAWAKEVGLTQPALWKRLYQRGWELARALKNEK